MRHEPRARVGWITWLGATAVLVLGMHEPVSGQDKAQRREVLARAIESVSDPDPLVRITALEEIIARGDATEMQLAIKAVLAASDADLKSVAVRAYVASLRDMHLDIRLPKELEETPDAAKHPQGVAALTAKRKLANDWSTNYSERFIVRIDKFDVKRGTFTAYGMNREQQPKEESRGDGQVTGSRVRMTAGFKSIYGIRRCSLELAPGPSMTLEGTATCDDSPKLLISMPMY